MILPGDLAPALEAELGVIRNVREVHGGCISSAARLEVGTGPVFVKFGCGLPADFFRVEANGLRRLASAGSGLRVPEAVGEGMTPARWSWLALEWLEPSSRRNVGELATGLAAMHRAGKDSRWGAEGDGFIGALAQDNQPASSWPEFWWKRRLGPQLALPGAARVRSAPEWAVLERRLPEILTAGEEEGPALLHGDLWSGNVLWTDDGPALIDPACYNGHREVDLAMGELFGGLGEGFMEAYTAAYPLRPGYEARRGVYQLYYLLVHVNLFGSAYVTPSLSTLRDILKLA